MQRRRKQRRQRTRDNSGGAARCRLSSPPQRPARAHNFGSFTGPQETTFGTLTEEQVIDLVGPQQVHQIYLLPIDPATAPSINRASVCSATIGRGSGSSKNLP